jgi:hypothetical protein
MRGTNFTCLPGTEVQVLTPEELSAPQYGGKLSKYSDAKNTAEANKAEGKSKLGPIERNAYTDDEPRAGA